MIHKTVSVQVWVDVDEGIANCVRYLNRIPGVRTHASCQGNIGESETYEYEPYVTVTWDDEAVLELLLLEFDVDVEGDHWGQAHPRKESHANA